MQSANITKGIVQRAAGTPRLSTFNINEMVVSINVKNFDGTSLNIWGKAGSEIERYKVGDAIEYCKSGKEYVFFNLPPQKSETDTQPTPSAAQAVTNTAQGKKWEEPPKEMKKDILNYSQFQAKVYLHIFKEVSNDFADMGLKDEQIKDISTTIFIQTQKKFNI